MSEKLVVTLFNTDAEERGTVELIETKTGVQLSYNLHNLPEGEFAMHIHETGLATPEEDFLDADTHWNPSHKEHGLEAEHGHHLGDLPNIVVDAEGKSSGIIDVEGASLEEDSPEGKYSFYNDGDGTSIIVHVEADGHQADSTSGARQLGGVIIPKQN